MMSQRARMAASLSATFLFLSLTRCVAHEPLWQDLSKERIACHVVEDAPSDVAYRPKTIHVMRGDGGERIEVGDGQHASWSPDGRTLVVVAHTFDSLLLLDTGDGDSAVLYSPGCCLDDPSWSPDGSRIAFLADLELWVMTADGSQARQLTDHGRRAFVEPPSWSQSGERIAFSVYSDPRSERAAYSLIWVINADGSEPDQLSDDTRYWHDPVWSPNDDRIVFHGYWDGEYHMMLMNADGSEQQPIGTGIPYGWSPDGSRIYFRTSFVNDTLWTMNADGSNRTRLFELDCEDPVWSPVIEGQEGVE